MSALNQYSQSFARQICDDFFDKNQSATGTQILNLTYIPQVNMFVISSLYEKWKAEVETFKSPFFNFEHADVQQALKVFMNVVSQHISVKRDILEPILVESTKNTLSLLLAPQQYFNDLLRDQPEFLVKAETIKQWQKYTRINQFVPQAIADRMADRPTVFVNQAIDWAEAAIQQNPEALEPTEKWLSAFSVIVPLDANTVFRKNNRPAPTPPDTTSEQSFFDNLSQEVPNLPIIEPQPAVSEPVATKEETTPNGFGNHLNSQVTPTESLNDTLKNETDTMADIWQKQSIANIAQNIPLGQKFMFVQQLFDSSNSAYDAAIEALDRATDYPAALNLIRKFTAENNWDTSTEAVVELLDVVKRRFGK